jgi:hypothetical protein
MGDFRPISCCNLIYKCITKLLANRLVPCLEAIISPNQTAFIPSRSIAENVLLAQEVLKDYHKNEGKARCTIKVDLMKAYDSVNWNFILHSLACFGFPAQFVSWIRECITSPRFSVALNGSLVGYFEGRKGLRQGDPLSPYLFVIAMEILSRLLSDYVDRNAGFSFHHKCSGVNLTHLCFADDLLIFSEASVNSVKVIKDVLLEFESLSGLKANPEKSSLFCAGASHLVKEQIIQCLNIQEGVLPVRYLGVPLISTRLKAADCSVLLRKFQVVLIPGLLRGCPLLGVFSSSLLFYIASRSIGVVSLSFLSKFFGLLSKNLAAFFGMAKMKVLQRLRSLGNYFVILRRRGFRHQEVSGLEPCLDDEAYLEPFC